MYVFTLSMDINFLILHEIIIKVISKVYFEWTENLILLPFMSYTLEETALNQTRGIHSSTVKIKNHTRSVYRNSS